MVTKNFQQLIWQIQKDFSGAHNLLDDGRVVGHDYQEDGENLHKFQEKNGITLKHDKCVICVISITYMGEVLKCP